MNNTKLVSNERGVCVYQHDAVLTMALNEPGPTNSVFDVLAAGVHAMQPGSDIVILGFASGGMLAPFFAMGGEANFSGIDLDSSGYELFEKVCSSWGGTVSFYQSNVVDWLKSTNRKFDIIVEDLSIEEGEDVLKPEISWNTLPLLIKQRLKPNGCVIFNLLRPISKSWADCYHTVADGFDSVNTIILEEYENRILLAGNYPDTTQYISRRIRSALRGIQSSQADLLSVRRVKM